MLAQLWNVRAVLLAMVSLLSLLICANTNAQITTLLDEVHTIALPTQAVPVEHDLNITVAGAYTVTLTDLGAQLTPTAPLASVQLAVTNGGTVVGTPLTAAGSLQFTASVGTYKIHVVGVPGTTPGSGPIGIQVTTGNTTFASFSDILALPSTGIPKNEAALDDTFTVQSSGSYTVTLSDLQFPQALTTVTLIITQSDGTIVTNPPLAAAGSATVSLQQGVTYRIFAVGQAGGSVNAGLYSAVVTPTAGGAPVYAKTIPVGTVGTPTTTNGLTAGTSYTLSLADLQFPAALSGLSGVVVLNGASVAHLTAAGTSQPFTAGSGTYQIFVSALTSANGSYAVTLAPSSGPPALSFARAVSAPGAAISGYSFDSPGITAGAYAFNVADFSIPDALVSLALTSLSAAVVQGGAIVGTPLTAAGTANVTVTAAPLSVVVFAQPAASAGGLFDVNLTASGATNPAFDATQGVGQLFATQQVSITAAGNYAIDVSDVGFPAPLQNFAVIVSRGSAQLGQIYTAGAFSFAATPGNYYVSFLAQPASTAGAGTYSLTMAPAPAVTLQASATSVTSGGTVTLTWTSQNATSCTASNGWSGSQKLNDTATSPAITATTTFTLTCNGTGINASQSVTVTVDTPPPTNSGGGGGGAIDIDLVLLLASLAVWRLWAEAHKIPKERRPC